MIPQSKSPERLAIEAYVREHNDEIRGMLLNGTQAKELVTYIEGGNKIAYSSFLLALHDAIPDLPGLLKAGKAKIKRDLEDAIVKAYAADEETFEEIQKRFRISSSTLRSIVKKHNLQRGPRGSSSEAKKAAHLKMYLEAIGTVVYDKIYGSPLKILEFIPSGKEHKPALKVECLNCGKVFEAPPIKTLAMLSTYCSCNVEAEDSNFKEQDRFPIAVIESKARLYCTCYTDDCSISATCHICCSECFKRDRCRCGKCQNDPTRCGRARKRTKSEGFGAWE